MDMNLFKSGADYWQVAANTKDIYLSDGSLMTLIDFERVLDSLDIYAFKNWEIGELVQGPIISKYKVSCTFLWPENLMPDPRGGRRLLPFDCDVLFRRTMMKIPIKIEEPDDYRPGTKKARIIEKRVWLVEIVMPKSLMSDIRTGSIELQDQDIDLQDLDDAWAEGVDSQEAQPEMDAAPSEPVGMAPGT
jgi:hypothetical protein